MIQMTQYQKSDQDKFVVQDQLKQGLFLQMRLGKAGQAMKILKLMEKLMQMS